MNVYERIFNIVNLLKEVETGISINKISEILGMPTEIIREDINKLVRKKILSIDSNGVFHLLLDVP